MTFPVLLVPRPQTPQNNALGKGILIQARVVGALILRETLTRYGRGKIGYLWAFAEPLLMLGVFYCLFLFRGRHLHGGMQLVPFLMTGIIVFQCIRNISSRLSTAVEANRGLLFYPQVTSLDTIIARAVLESLTFFTVFAVIIAGAWLVGWATLPDNFFGVLRALFMAAMFGLSWGIVEWAITLVWPLFNQVMRVVWRISVFTSCVFYNIRDVPVRVQKIFELNPIANVIELLRSAYFAGYMTPVKSYAYVTEWIIVLLFMGLLMERMFRNRAKEA